MSAHTFAKLGSAIAPMAMLAVSLTALPANAQQAAYTLSMTGAVSQQPMTGAQLTTQLMNGLRLRKGGSDTVRARLMMILSKGGKPEQVFISKDFELGGGAERSLPAGVFPSNDWVPDGSAGGAAFGWFPDWLNRLLGLSTTPQEIDPNANPAADAYYLSQDAKNKAAQGSNIFGPGNKQLHSGPAPTAGVATLSMIVLPVSGAGAATASAAGVSMNLGK